VSTVVKVTGIPSFSYYKDYIFLGVIHVVDGTIKGITNSPLVAKQVSDSVNGLMHSAIKITDADLMPVDSALSFWQEAGSIYYPGINWHDTDHRQSNIIAFSSIGSTIDPIPFNVISQLGTKHYTAKTALTVEYDVGGVLTTIPATKATIHRLYSMGIDTVQRQYFLLLGQNLYATADAAKENVYTETIVYPTEISSMTFMGYIGVTAEATDFTDSSNAWIVNSISAEGGSSEGVFSSELVINTISTSSTLTVAKQVAVADTAGIVITLPDGAINETIVVKNISGGSITVTATGTIDDSTEDLIISVNNTSTSFVPYGADWLII